MTVTQTTQIFFDQNEWLQMLEFAKTHPDYHKVSEQTIGTLYEKKEIYVAELRR